MTTTLRNLLSSVLLTLFVLPVLVSAQTDEVSATTTPVVEEVWYEVEKLFGRVDSGDFVVGPGRSEINLNPGESQTITISVANRISDDRTFKLEVADITGSVDGSSALQLVEDGRGPYSIIDYIDIPEETITLKLGERARIPLTVSVPIDAEPGGFYGSILVSTIQAGSGPDEVAPRNPIIARVGSHVFLTVGGARDFEGSTIKLDTLPSAAWYTKGPINFGIAYENTGSVHLNPYGELSIKNILGEEVGYLELEPWFVLPKSLRTREIQWDRELLFGRYTAQAKVNRGYEDIVDEVSVSFWVLPYKLVGAVFAVFFLIFFLMRMFFKTFEFKRK